MKTHIPLILLLSLCSCENIKHSLGLTHYQPNEYNVTKHPPLEIPKTYELKAPAAESTHCERHISTRKEATTQSQSLLKYTPPLSRSSGKIENVFRVKLHQNGLPLKNIRAIVDSDALLAREPSPSLARRVATFKQEFHKSLTSYKTDTSSPQKSHMEKEH